MEKRSILLVEPADGPVRQMALLGGGHDVFAYSDPRAGLAAAAERKPSVVLISLRQSTSHGLSLAKALRKKLGTQPMIVVYGRPTRSQRRALSKYGAGGAREAWGVDRLLAEEPTRGRLDEVVYRLEQSRLRSEGTIARREPDPQAVPEVAALKVEAPEPVSMSASYEMRRAAREAAASMAAQGRVQQSMSWRASLVQGFRQLFQRMWASPTEPESTGEYASM